MQGYAPVGSTTSEGDPIVPAGEVNDPTIRPETDDEASEQGPDEEWKFWKDQIAAALLAERRWRSEAEECESQYFGPDDDPGAGGEGVGKNVVNDKVALIHANVDVLKPLMFSETPVPIVRRRFRGDGKADATDLFAAELGQRAAEYLLDTEPLQEAVERARDDWLIAGRGQCRVVYKAEFEKQAMMAQAVEGAMDPTAPPIEVKIAERVTPCDVDWRRFTTAAGHSWRTMPWIGFEVPMTRTAIKNRFPDHAPYFTYPRSGLAGATSMTMDDSGNAGGFGSDTETGAKGKNPFDTAAVWEIWNRDSGEVIWWSEHCKKGVLDREADPLQLEHFFPCPMPLLATTKGSELTPRPDIKYYERRAKEIEVASLKMKNILDAISVSGVCPGSLSDTVKSLLDGKSKIIAVEEWLKFMERGGVNGMIQWLPLDMMMQAVQALGALREQAKAAMFEASGVSDIMRAQGDPSETATAQQLKGRYAGMRLSEKQKKTATFARDLLRIMMEVALEHFDLQFWVDMTALDLPVTQAEREMIALQDQMMRAQFEQLAQQHAAIAQAVEAGLIPGPVPPAPEPPPEVKIPETSYEEVLARLKTDYGRKITLTIETDSTILADEVSDKESRIEFLSAFASMSQNLLPLVQGGQIDMATIKELLLFGVRAFPKTRNLEALIADLPDEVEMEQAPDASIQVAQIRAEIDKMIAEMESADKEKDRAHEMKLKGVELAQDAAHMIADAPPAPTPELPPPPGQGA